MARRILLPLLVLVLLGGTLLSGCADGGQPSKGGDSTPLQPADLEIDASSPFGGISGVVVDEAIRPIARATVLVVSLNKTQVTDGNGQFAFPNLEPGAYFLNVNATGFFAVQTSIDVTAGAASPVRIQLATDSSPVPYPTTFAKTGYIEVGASIATLALNLVVDELLNDSLCNCYMEFTVPVQTQAFVIEGTWQSAIPCDPLPDEMYYQIYNGTANIHIESAFLANPIYVVLNKTAIWGDQVEFVATLTEGGECPRYNQKFDFFVTAWSNGWPPKGWSIVAGNA